MLILALTFLSVCPVNTESAVSGFADSVIYSFKTEADTQYFVKLVQPLATYVRDHEQAITYTFRPFVSADGLSVLILERFISQAAHDGPHANSTVHAAFKANLAAWNASTQAVTARIHSNLNESFLGTFDRQSSRSVGVSGYAHSATYSFKDETSKNHFMMLLEPLATYVCGHESQEVYTFRPFSNIDDNSSVTIIERFPSKEAHDGPYLSSIAHQKFEQEFTRWDASTKAVTKLSITDWKELAMGVFDRGTGGLADSVIV